MIRIPYTINYNTRMDDLPPPQKIPVKRRDASIRRTSILVKKFSRRSFGECPILTINANERLLHSIRTSRFDPSSGTKITPCRPISNSIHISPRTNKISRTNSQEDLGLESDNEDEVVTYDFDNYEMGKSGGRNSISLSNRISTITRSKSMNLRDSNISNDECNEICRVLSQSNSCPALISIDLSRCSIGLARAAQIVECVEHCSKRLQTLRLSRINGNTLRPVTRAKERVICARRLGRSIGASTRLTSVDISGNNIQSSAFATELSSSLFSRLDKPECSVRIGNM